MPLAVLVTNQPPEIDENVPEPLKDLFQAYIRARDGKAYPLFRHQAEVFRRVSEDQEVFLVAGTAAGKTLAIAVPLLHKLREATLPDGRARLAFHMGVTPEMVSWLFYYGSRVQVLEPAWLLERVAEEHGM